MNEQSTSATSTVPGLDLTGDAPAVLASVSLLDQISDPLEAVANLVYLLEDEAEDCTKVREYGRLLTRELARIIAAAQGCLPPGSPCRKQLAASPG